MHLIHENMYANAILTYLNKYTCIHVWVIFVRYIYKKKWIGWEIVFLAVLALVVKTVLRQPKNHKTITYFFLKIAIVRDSKKEWAKFNDKIYAIKFKQISHEFPWQPTHLVHCRYYCWECEIATHGRSKTQKRTYSQ